MKKLLVLFLTLVVCASALVACDLPFFPKEEPAEITYKLDKAVAYVKALYINEQIKPDDSEIAFATKYDDFKLVSQVMIAGVAYDVTWSVDLQDEAKVKVVQGQGITETVIDVDSKSDVDFSFTLTATVKAGDGTSDNSLTFNFFVPKYDVISYEDYRAKADGETATVEGIVVALNSVSAGNKRNHVFAVDASGKGGYYAYDMADDPVALGIEVGMTVAISGEVDIYNGMYELKDAAVRVTNTEKTTPAAIDVTTKFAAGENILEYVGALITIQGVEIGAQELGGTSDYLYFSLNGVQSYIRTYVTDMPTSFVLTRDENDALTCADKAIMDGTHAEKFGWTANVTGVLIAYNGAPYLMPIDANCFEYLNVVEKTDAEKLAIELDALTISNAFNANAELELALAGKYYNNVVLSWTSDKDCIVIADGKATITIPEDATTVTLTVTAAIGETTAEKTFEIKLAKGPMAFKDALAAVDGTKVVVKGTVKEINTAWSEQYGNITVTIEDSEGTTIYVYRMKTNVKVGDIITVSGQMATYNDNRQIGAGATATIDDPAPVEVTIPEALELADGRRVIVKGTVKAINTPWSEQYGNITVTIEDTEGNTLYVYRLATNVQVGDIVTITGKMGTFGGNRQIAQGATAEIGETEEPAGPTLITIPEALELADGAEVMVQGTVKEINTAWSEQYGNITVTIEDKDGNTLYVYRLATKVNKGDLITITGKMGSFNGNKQIAQGATATIDDAAPVEMTIAEALEAKDGTKVIVKGTVKEINTAWSEQYKNITVTIEDTEGNTLYIYRLATNVQEGDTVTITGAMATYNGNRQIGAGATAVIGDAE